MKQIVAFLPLLLKRKKTLLLAVLAGYYFLSNGSFRLPEVAGMMPDLSIDRLWKEPRDILVDRVEEVRDVQQQTVEEFRSALEQFKAVTGFKSGDLEKQYETLNAAFERSEDAAERISTRVDKVVAAANTLLDEWRTELEDYHDPSLRRRAEAQFDRTRRQAEALIAAMRRAEQRTWPVLAAFRDQVLYIKHNLNMQAITSLTDETRKIETDVGMLIREMERSIAEANAFIESLSKTG
ncbi:MAG TPA: DUF2959 domain-containing protein [Chromatiales bacterium]|nr:DUF2959 domain-containing protein [Chromatiales bacterium]